MRSTVEVEEANDVFGGGDGDQEGEREEQVGGQQGVNKPQVASGGCEKCK
jgi:hypothetical protein